MKTYFPPLLMKERLSLRLVSIIYHMAIKKERVEAPFNLVIALECAIRRLWVNI